MDKEKAKRTPLFRVFTRWNRGGCLFRLIILVALFCNPVSRFVEDALVTRVVEWVALRGFEAQLFYHPLPSFTLEIGRYSSVYPRDTSNSCGYSASRFVISVWDEAAMKMYFEQLPVGAPFGGEAWIAVYMEDKQTFDFSRWMPSQSSPDFDSLATQLGGEPQIYHIMLNHPQNYRTHESGTVPCSPR